MSTGVCAILVWNKLVKPKTGIDGAFFCMLVNGFSMMVAHYWHRQPKGTGWVGENDEVKQRRQAESRKRTRNREKLKAFFTKDKLANLTPDKRKLTYAGAYVLLTSFVSLILVNKDPFNYWCLCQILIASSFIGLAFMRTANTPFWGAGLHWVIGLFFCLGLNTFFHWWNVVDFNFTFFLSLSYLVMALLLLPLSLGISMVVVTILISLYPICRMGMPWLSKLSTPTLLLYIVQMILVCAIIIYQKVQINMTKKQVRRLKLQKKKREEEELKEITYTFNITEKPAKDVSEEDGAILENVVRNVTASISFLDHKQSLYRHDFQSIVNKFADWAAFLKRRSKSKDHLLLFPRETTIEDLISQVEVAVEVELGKIPQIFVENERRLTIPMVCDVDKIVDLLVTAVLKIVDKDTIETDMVTMRFNSSSLAYHRCDDVKDMHPRWRPFGAIGITISNYNTPQKDLPIVLPCYNDTNPLKILEHNSPENPAPIGLTSRKMYRIIRAHYGYMELPEPGKDGIMIVIPRDVNEIRDEMIANLPIDLLASESPITPKEQADSLMDLMEFHEYVCKVSHVESAVIAEILLLLRRCYGFKRHASGQLFYVRATGITKIVAKWIFHSPKPIYATLLYDLVRHTHLSRSYIRANYNFGIFCFVESVLSVDNRKELSESVLFVENRLQEAVAQDKLSVL